MITTEPCHLGTNRKKKEKSKNNWQMQHHVSRSYCGVRLLIKRIPLKYVTTLWKDISFYFWYCKNLHRFRVGVQKKIVSVQLCSRDVVFFHNCARKSPNRKTTCLQNLIPVSLKTLSPVVQLFCIAQKLSTFEQTNISKLLVLFFLDIELCSELGLLKNMKRFWCWYKISVKMQLAEITQFFLFAL